MPTAYQERDGRRARVGVAYTLQTVGDTVVHGIHAGAYDPHTPHMIDRVIRHPGFIGESDSEGDDDIAADPAGAVRSPLRSERVRTAWEERLDEAFIKGGLRKWLILEKVEQCGTFEDR